MARKLYHNGFKLALWPFLSNYNNPDRIDQLTKTEQSIELSKTGPETGWDRIKRLFKVDEFGNVTPEVNSIIQTACLSLLFGGIYGGTVQSKDAYERFMKNNQATTFTNHLEAKRKLQETVTHSFGKGALKFGWRLILFSTTYVGVSTLIQTYRGKYGIIEYVGGGAVTGFIYKFNLGPRGWIVGSGLGSVLGLVCGLVTQGLLKVSGMTMEEARYWQYKWKDDRTEYLRKGREKHLEENDFAVIKLHDDAVGEAGRSLSHLDKDTNNIVK